MSINWAKRITVADKEAGTVKQAAIALREEVRNLETVDSGTIRILLTLIDTLLSKGVVAVNDFTSEERQLYQRAKVLKGQIW